MDPNVAPPSKPTRIWPVVLVLLLLAGGGVVGWGVFLTPRGREAAVVVEDAGVAEVLDAGPSRSVDEGDALLKQLAARWSADAEYARWLDSLSLRHLVSATLLVAEGNSPRPALPFLSLSAPFSVREEQGPPPPRKKKGPPPPREERLFISAESTARYDVLVKVLGSVDAAAAGDAWARLEPYCDAAFGEISRPGTRFRDTLTTAVKRVLAVQVPEGELEVVGRGGVYVFKDPALEARSALDKQLLRMGAANAKVLQEQLRVFAAHAHLE
ncbi:MAG: DUF3014 domain-containing protein [Myxococcota bacterium]